MALAIGIILRMSLIRGFEHILELMLKMNMAVGLLIILAKG